MVGFRSRLSWRSASLRPGQSATTRPALQRAAGEEGGGRGAVVGAIVAVDVRGAAELGDQRNDPASIFSHFPGEWTTHLYQHARLPARGQGAHSGTEIQKTCHRGVD